MLTLTPSWGKEGFGPGNTVLSINRSEIVAGCERYQSARDACPKPWGSRVAGPVLSPLISSLLWAGPRAAVTQLNLFSGSLGNYSGAAASRSCLNTDGGLEMRNLVQARPLKWCGGWGAVCLFVCLFVFFLTLYCLFLTSITSLSGSWRQAAESIGCCLVAKAIVWYANDLHGSGNCVLTCVQ